MKRAREEDDAEDGVMAPVGKEARQEDPIAEHLAILSSRALLPELLVPIFRSIHISDQLMVMMVSCQWRAIVIPVIVKTHVDMAAIDSALAHSVHFFERNERAYGFEVQRWSRDHMIININEMENSAYGMSVLRLDRQIFVMIPVDPALYQRCEVCESFFTRRDGAIPICSTPCLNRAVLALSNQATKSDPRRLNRLIMG